MVISYGIALWRQISNLQSGYSLCSDIIGNSWLYLLFFSQYPYFHWTCYSILLILGLYGFDAIGFIIRNCILGHQVSKKELEEIIISTQQRLELKHFNAPILLYAWLAFVMYIPSQNPLAILLLPLWTVDLYITLTTALSCAKKCLMTVENTDRFHNR